MINSAEQNKDRQGVTATTELDKSSSKVQPRASYKPEIDGLRALAVIAVIVNHFNPSILPSGFLGVDIFFVISGFVVTSSLANKSDSSWKDYLLTFYSRRVKRLFPALAACVVITSIVGCCFIYTIVGPGGSLRTGTTALFGMSNLYLFIRSTDYFGGSAELDLFTQTWSLGVEEQFYLVFPILVGICGFSRRQRHKGRQNLFLTVLSLSVLSLISYLYLSKTNQSAAFFLMPTRFWELGAGCLTFLATRRFSQRSPDYLDIIAAPFSVLLLISVLFLGKDLQTFNTIGVAFSTCAVILLFNSKSLLVKVFSWKWIVQIGLLSYSLYLWHWSVLVISRWTIGVSKWTIPFQFFLVLGLALASYNLIERPLRYAQWSTKKYKTVCYGLSITSISAILLICLGLGANNATSALYLGSSDSVGYVHPKTYPHKSTAPQIPGTLITRENCWLRYEGSDMQITPSDIAKCRAERNSSFKTVYVYGDSFAAHLAPLISKLYREYPVNLEFLLKGGCPFPSKKFNSNDCKKFSLERQKRVLSSAKKGDLLVIAEASVEGTLDTTFAIEKTFDSDFIRALESIASTLSKRGVSVVFQAPLPKLPSLSALEACMQPVQWFNKGLASICSKVETEPISTHFQMFSQKYEQLSKLSLTTGLILWNPLPKLCPGQVCSSHINGFRAYSNNDHLSTLGAEYLYGDFVQLLKKHSLL